MMKNSNKKMVWTKTILMSTVATLAMTGLARAAETPADETPAAPVASALEEVIVTAQKRAENLQAVSLSLTAFSGDFLEKSKIEGFNDLKSRTPGLIYEEFTPGQPRYFIRGIGSIARSSAVDSAVGIFVDEVYMGRPESVNNDFFGIERVEVLRGPQGTLFGRNVVGGAVSFFTRKPTEDLKAQVAATYGNYNLIEGKAYVNGALTDKLFGSVSVTSRNHDGYAFNTTTGNDLEDEQFISARAALRYVANDDLDIQLNADISRRRGTGVWWDLYREGAASIGKSNPDPRRGANDTSDGNSDVDNKGVSLHIQWDAGIGDLTSITAYRESELAARSNTTGLYVAGLTDPNKLNYFHTLFIQEDDQSAKQFSQEIRLASQGDTRLSWVGGLFYFHENVDHAKITDYRFIRFNLQGHIQYDANTVTDAFAAFANASYKFTDAFSVQAGLRWSHDQKDHVSVASGNPFVPFRNRGVIVSGWTSEGDDSWSALTPALSLNYQIVEDKYLYATVSRGFKSGGFNDQETEKLAADTSFAPEYAWNYEAGLKSEWFDKRLRINASFFYLDYKDLQVSIVQQVDPNLPPIGVTGNAGKATVKGVELEWVIVPVEGLTLYGNYTYTDSKIKDLISGNANLDGNKLAKAPKHKLFAGASYSLALDDTTTATARVDYTYSSNFFSTINNSPIELIPTQHSLDAGLRLDLAEGRWGVEVWGKNLTDELNVNSLSNVSGDGFASFSPPRTYGVTLHFRY